MKVTLITGASLGIGQAFAKQLASEKHNLLLIARSENKLKVLCDELMAKYNIKAYYFPLDLTKPGADQTLFEETETRGLQVDFQVNNAGIGSAGDFLEHDLQSEIAMMHLNMDAMVALTYRFLPQMRARKRGKIVNVSPMAGFIPIPYMAVYAASKAFVHSFTQGIAEENRLFNIQTMLLCPGTTETNFFEAAQIGADRKSSFSTNKLETPEEVVTSGLKGLKRNKRVTISGTQNKLARLMQFVPNSVIIKALGNRMRKNLNYV